MAVGAAAIARRDPGGRHSLRMGFRAEAWINKSESCFGKCRLQATAYFSTFRSCATRRAGPSRTLQDSGKGGPAPHADIGAVRPRGEAPADADRVGEDGPVNGRDAPNHESAVPARAAPATQRRDPVRRCGRRPRHCKPAANAACNLMRSVRHGPDGLAANVWRFLAETEVHTREVRPALPIAGGSASPRAIDFERMAAIAEAAEA